jgi:formylglycine-generating enzyme required for sulfatase activity
VIHNKPLAVLSIIPGGLYTLGSDDHYGEEAPARKVRIEAFGLETQPVTNAEFARFVAATGWITVCERLKPAGSAVFAMTPGPVDLHRPDLWWRFAEGACWNRPTGPGSDLEGLSHHPVVHVALEDARAYAAWAGRRLPTEPEWEAAARGGLVGQPYAWGAELEPDGRAMAHIWKGAFPWWSHDDQVPGPCAVRLYPANGYGLFDMIGNVWEWTDDRFTRAAEGSGCGCSSSSSSTPTEPHTLKGGSFLCSPDYCARYRPAARIGLSPETSSQHIGFRCAMDLPPIEEAMT